MNIGLIADNLKNKTFLTPDDLAELFCISRATIYRLIDGRQLPFHKIGGSIRFFKVDVENYLNKVRVEPIARCK
jgi:excisionase family DNA binding protein